MNYGYIVGQEAMSLLYYEARLEKLSGPQERKQIERVIENLRRAVEAKQAGPPTGGRGWTSLNWNTQGGIGR
jgi:hypothetical protein